MAHKFAKKLSLDPQTGAPLAKGPVDPATEEMYRIWVWISQDETKAAARGSFDWGNNPVSPEWECPTTLFADSPRFEAGKKAKGMAVAWVKDGTAKKYYGWWDEPDIEA